MQYSHVDESSDSSSRRRGGKSSSDTRSVTSISLSSKSKYRHKRINSDLSEPLTSPTSQTSGDEDGRDGDPFFVFREDLRKKLEIVDDSLSEFLRVVHETDTAVNEAEFKDCKKQLKRHIKNAESTLKDVQTTVQVVENDREKFPHIDDTQLYERKTLVNTSKERLVRAKEEMNSEANKLKILADERNRAIRHSGDGLMGARTDNERENTAFILDNQAQTSLLMHQQDETLDELGEAVTRVGDLAGNIHDEIGFQNKMLEQMDEDMADAEEQLGFVMGKLGKFLKTKDKWQLRTIIALTLTAVVLLFLVLYT